MPATVLGWSVSKDNFSSAVEYMYRDEGYDQAEQDAFFDYYQAHPEAASQFSSSYVRCAFVKNYLGINVNQNSLFKLNDLSGGLSLLGSWQPGTNLRGDYSSCEISVSLGYTFKQNLGLWLRETYRTGGQKGEFNRLNPEQYNISLSANLAF
ncbi:MAG TPA: hypothetical protein VHY08_10075 [Bacillota bacterium]|nr:hypothetical protein [Bacillota bacterium]